VVFGFLKERRRMRLREQRVPAAWRAIVERNLPIFRRLPPADQAELLGHVQVFLSEKIFEGCGGLELTDEIRITIAAQACLLLLHRDTDYYPWLTTILVYPSGYAVDVEESVAPGIWEERDDHRLGHTGRRLSAMVLAWDSAKHGAADPADGDNLVLHEFAHQLDFENAAVDGTPALETRAEYLAWGRVMGAEFEALRAAEEADAPTVLDTYGTENPAEFFAVATEAFFERPRALKSRHPNLYAELQRFFRQDPTGYSSEDKGPTPRPAG
jgi:Mlc titration factor MtfA (ptsG expression regulator)